MLTAGPTLGEASRCCCTLAKAALATESENRVTGTGAGSGAAETVALSSARAQCSPLSDLTHTSGRPAREAVAPAAFGQVRPGAGTFGGNPSAANGLCVDAGEAGVRELLCCPAGTARTRTGEPHANTAPRRTHVYRSPDTTLEAPGFTHRDPDCGEAAELAGAASRQNTVRPRIPRNTLPQYKWVRDSARRFRLRTLGSKWLQMTFTPRCLA